MSQSELTNEEAAWLAGFLDGEGSIRVQRNISRHKGKTYTYTYMRFELTNTNKECLYDVLHMIGAGTVFKVAFLYPARRKDCYRYILMGSAAMKIIKRIRPYLRIKYKQADAVLATGDYHLTEATAEQLMLLNKRGKA